MTISASVKYFFSDKFRVDYMIRVNTVHILITVHSGYKVLVFKIVLKSS